jgi:CHAT domain-containing protein/lipoprotein NlpI
MPQIMKNIFFTLLYFLLITNSLLAQKADEKTAKTWLSTADSLFEKGEYEKSNQLLEKAKQAYLQLDNANMLMNTQNKIARNLIRQGKFDEALVLLTSAEQTYQSKVNASEQNNYIYKGEFYNLIGEVYLNKGRNDIALEFFQKAMQHYDALKTAANMPEKAECYENLGLFYWNAGNNELALEYQNRSLDLRKKIFGENHPEVADSYNNIGLIYGTEDPAQAQKFYRNALNIYKEIYGENHPKIANTYNNLAIISQVQEKYDVALFQLESALEITKEVYGENHPNNAFIYSTIGQIFSIQDKDTAALAKQETALKIYKQAYGEKHPEIANTYNLLGTLYFKQGKFKEALQTYQSALIANVADFQNTNIYENPSADKAYKVISLLNTLRLKAEVFENWHYAKTLKLKDLETALTTLELCDKIIDKMRQTALNKNDKVALGKIAAEVYEDAIRVSLGMSLIVLKKDLYRQKAFNFAEKSKSYILLQSISETNAKNFAKIPKDLIDKEKQLKEDIAYAEQKLASKPSASEETMFRNQLFELNRQYDNFSKDLEKNFPEYYNLKYSVKISDIKSLQQIIDNETVLLSYFIGDKSGRLYIFAISQNSFEVFDLPKLSDLDTKIRLMRNAIYYKIPDKFIPTAHALYKQLFPKSFAGKKQIVVIPDGRLGTIPFEALLTNKVEIKDPKNIEVSNLPYLIKKQAVSYAYSATLFQQRMEGESKGTYSENNYKKIFVCAPINFYGRSGLNDLPATEKEVEGIKGLFGEGLCSVFTKDKANEGLIKSGILKEFNYIHFATHGIVNESNPELSQIFLAKPSETPLVLTQESIGERGKSLLEVGAAEDGNLHSGEIYSLELNADLVILSACQTGLGKVAKGEGIIGLSRALLYAGAKNLLVSLWSVADESTAKLALDFYSFLLKGENKTEALRLAKVKMIEEGVNANPNKKELEVYYWSPFVLIGK